MCGITGAVWTAAEKAIDAELLMRMTDVLRAPWSRRLGRVSQRMSLGRCGRCDTRRGAGVSPAVDHRFGVRQPAVIERRWLGVGCIQRRDLQLRSLASPSGRCRASSFAHAAMVRRSCTCTRMWASIASRTSMACLRSPFGIAPKRQLVLGRDRLGQKPLVYRCEADRLLFASELKSLLQVPGHPPRHRSHGDRSVPDLSVCTSSPHDLSWHFESCLRGTTPFIAIGQLTVAALLGPGLQCDLAGYRRGGHRTAAVDAGVVGGVADAERRAARRISFRRRRFVVDRGPHAEACFAAGQDILDRISR